MVIRKKKEKIEKSGYLILRKNAGTFLLIKGVWYKIQR